ncbi:hypothetical protein JDV02_002885 [Purpureocillium takamizusanense]|uniref:ABC transporter n=1 Tax=Purpureocillium takamizusanense TaxID=2060973 RepID=A0A9Q8QBV1_9HYPO|nr:uncharacterized protein JDV02_002885 [Purpureocillium takamizusanense]UNI16453.1 hypothetical protein JDV02_002885 [Purpureocillium takamizusanense]
MSAPTACLDSSFGPWAGAACRGGFDFTLLFEETILSILSSAIVILVAPIPIVRLARKPPKVRTSALDWLKKTSSICFVLLSAALVGLWARNSTITQTRASIPCAVLTFVLSIVYTILSSIEHRLSLRPSSVLSLYLGLSVLFDIARTRTLFMLDNASDSAIPPVFASSLALRVVMLLLESTEKRSLLLAKYNDAAPESVGGPYNLGVFYWLSTLFFTGYRKILEIGDLYPLDDELRSMGLAQKMSDAWGKVPDKTIPNVLFVTWLRTFSKTMFMPVIPRIFQIGFTYAQPFLITAAIELAATPQTQPYNNNGYGLIGAYVLVYTGIAVSVGQYEWRNYRAATMMRGSIIPLIYQKSLALDSCSTATFHPTAALTLVSTDIETITSGLVQIHETWSNLVEIGLAIYLLERQLGVACVMSVGFALVVMVGTVFLAKPTGTHLAAWIQASQVRVIETSKALASIKWLKISGLTDVAFSVIQNLRKKELVVSEKFRYLLGLSLVLSICTPIMGPLLTFAVFAGIATHGGSTLTIAKVFTAFSIIVLLNSPLAKIVQALPQIFGSIASFQRIQDHLNADERHDPRSTASDARPESAHAFQKTISGSHKLTSPAELSDDTMISIEGKFSWRSEAATTASGTSLVTRSDEGHLAAGENEDARDIPVIDISPRLDIPRGALTLILGPVGCGKSTLLKALLGELSSFDGVIAAHYSGAVTYCDQNPWLPNETVKDIIRGRSASDNADADSSEKADFDEDWYRVVVGSCELQRDMQIWPRGDMTPVGSKGISMSGGQKQRLSIARAVYARRALVIFDDVFSGLDANTEDIVFEKLLGNSGLLRKANMTVVLASSDVRRVPFADKIVLLNQHGQVEHTGVPADLKQVAELGWADRDVDAQHSKPGNDKSGRKQGEQSESAPETLRRSHTNHGPDSSAAVQEVLQAVESQADTARQMGDSAVYKFYVKSAGWLTMTIFLIAICVYAFCDSFPSVWLKWWAEANEKNPNSDLGKWLGVYAVLGVGAVAACLIGTWQLFIITINRSGLYFHNLLVETVSRAPMMFHSTTDTGITVNRFSQDLQLIDMELPSAALGVVMALSFGVAQFILVCVSSRYMAALLPFLLVVLYAIQHFYLRTARQLRLLDIEYKAPLYTQLMETISGVVTIRAFRWEAQSTAKAMRILDISQRPSYLLFCVQRWITFAVNMVIMVLAVILIVFTTTLREAIGPGYVGIALSNILAFSATMQATITSWVTLEIALGAVARIRSFSMQVRSEDDEARDSLAKAGVDAQLLSLTAETVGEWWPSQGRIELDNVTASYPSSGRVLYDITMVVEPGQKVAICGRTGSGKSSLFLSLLGLITQDSGSIVIDGVDLATLPREYLRSQIVAVPQEAYILDGTVRLNADPYHNKESLGSANSSGSRDDQIIDVLKRVGLWEKIAGRGGLDMVIDDKFLSQGQAQLMVLARAMLRKDESRVLLLDEATSSLDEATTTLIDEIVSTWFKDWTILAIAHKLDAILDYDRVAVLDAGRLVEYDQPRALLQRPASIFKELYLLSTNQASSPTPNSDE